MEGPGSYGNGFENQKEESNISSRKRRAKNLKKYQSLDGLFNLSSLEEGIVQEKVNQTKKDAEKIMASQPTHNSHCGNMFLPVLL